MNNLPIGYTKCEYIEGNGMQYIDTRLVVNKSDNKKMLLTALFTNDAYGGANGYMQFKSGICINKKATISIEYANNVEKIYVDGVLSSTDDWTSRYNGSNVRLGLFKIGEEENKWHDQAQQIGKLYSCQIYDNGSLVRDYIPCQDMYGVYGLYDLVNNVFYQSVSEYGFTGKWAEDKKLLVSPSEFRKRLMMLAVTDKKPDYSKLRGVFIEDIDGGLYTQNEWDGSKTPNGIAVITENCQFVMALQHAHTSYCQWGSFGTEVTGVLTTTDGTTAKTDYRGNENTTAILNQLGNSSSTSDAPAAYYCRAFTFPNGKKGYLGSAGEWQAALNNKNAIVSALSKCGGTAMIDYYWTSTQYSSSRSWYMGWYVEDLRISTKSSDRYVRAFAALKYDSGGDDVVTISFGIDGVEYQAEEGMTFGEWIDSRYNTDGFFISSSGDKILAVNGWYLGFDGYLVDPQEVIQEGTMYVLF